MWRKFVDQKMSAKALGWQSAAWQSAAWQSAGRR